ncbi:MAG: choice-of-anchor J domain-containing protein, partial [Candidatus Cloacimonetes bacterium]|nr:choice-of-anchor J domain-containing protein [Candidatus Cloacimonadota bacterium]
NNPIVEATVNVGGRTAQTMGDGYYTISNIVAETYQLICSKSGYPGASVSVEIPANGTLNQDINLNWARAIPNQTEFTKEQYVNQSKGYPFTVNNPGTVGLNYTTDSGVWGGDTVLSGNLNQDWEDYNWTGWSGIIGPNTDVYYGYGHEGGESGTFVFESLNCSTTQWLITPQMNVRDGDNFSFWYKQFNNTNEVLNVLVSTDTADTTDFRNTLATIGPMSDTNWTLASYSLNAYTGQNIYIAFYYTKILTQYAYVFIDEITGPEAFLPPMEWLSCSMEEGTIASNATENLSLLVDTNGMQPGHYTAQTWIFSDGVISPVKLYMDLTVSQLLDAEVPQNVAILLDNPVTGDVTISWDTSANAVQYEIYAAPYTTTFENYVHIGSTALTTATISASTLAGFGITGNICMFRITANNENIARFTISRDRQKPVIGLQRMKSPFAGPRTLTVR